MCYYLNYYFNAFINKSNLIKEKINSMYKLLLVEDDAIIREGIRENISWGKLGFNFIGEYEDGSQAIGAIDKFKPDVILTDICMPFLDGLELANYVYERFPTTKIILITGYNKFDYAQKAIKLNVYDFILKPITPDELINILKKIKSDLDKEKIKKRNLIYLRKKLNENYSILKDRFLNKILYGELKSDEIKNGLKYFSINFQYSFYSTIVIDIDDSNDLKLKLNDQKYELLSLDIFNYCKQSIENLNIEGKVFCNKDGYIVILINEISIDILNRRKILAAENIRLAIEELYETTVTIGVGTNCRNLEKIPISFQNAVTAIEYRFLMGNNQTICYEDLIKTHTIEIISIKKWDKEIALSLKTGKFDETKILIKEMINNLKKNMISIEKSYVHIQKIIALIYNIINELSIEETEVFVENKNPFLYIYNFKTLNKLEQWIIEIMYKVHKLIIDKKNDFSKNKILLAESFIKENYNNENMSLSSICFYLCMSKSRFSPLFKKHTGMTFIKYLTNVRIEKSMELLKTTSLMTYEIASKVGFSDAHYFSLIFKKINSITPTDFRINLVDSMLS